MSEYDPIFLNRSAEPFARAGTEAEAHQVGQRSRRGVLHTTSDRRTAKIVLLVVGLLLVPVLFWVLTAEPENEPQDPMYPRPTSSAR